MDLHQWRSPHAGRKWKRGKEPTQYDTGCGTKKSRKTVSSVSNFSVELNSSTTLCWTEQKKKKKCGGIKSHQIKLEKEEGKDSGDNAERNV